MPQPPFRSFYWTLIVVCAVLGAAGVVYARMLALPASIAAPIIAAFLGEASFYLVPGFADVRRAFAERWRQPVLAVGLALSGAIPYCLYALPTGVFRWNSVALLLAAGAAVAFWYVLFPKRGPFDAAFLVMMAAIILCKVFSFIYASPVAGLHLEILGYLMLTRLGVWTALSFRSAEGIGFGFLPTRGEWAEGVRHYLYFIPIGLFLAITTGLLRFAPMRMTWWQMTGVGVGTFLGMLWVVALAEEFFFRGLLQQWLSSWLGNRTAGLVIASVVFGLVHLPFRSFPNWRFALVAAVAGLFYGRAYSRSGSVRAAMVAHALVNTTTRLLFA